MLPLGRDAAEQQDGTQHRKKHHGQPFLTPNDQEKLSEGSRAIAIPCPVCATASTASTTSTHQPREDAGGDAASGRFLRTGGVSFLVFGGARGAWRRCRKRARSAKGDEKGREGARRGEWATPLADGRQDKTLT